MYMVPFCQEPKIGCHRPGPGGAGPVAGIPGSWEVRDLQNVWMGQRGCAVTQDSATLAVRRVLHSHPAVTQALPVPHRKQDTAGHPGHAQLKTWADTDDNNLKTTQHVPNTGSE